MNKNTQHTPGPWKSQGFRVIRADEMEAWQQVVATIPKTSGKAFDENADAAAKTLEQQRANAALIAAAPELLEWLTWALDAMDKAQMPLESKPYRQQARAAIAKATGDTEGGRL